jgi:hypothetical protein
LSSALFDFNREREREREKKKEWGLIDKFGK